MSERYSSFERELCERGKIVYTNVGVSMMPLIRENRDVMVIEILSAPPKKYQAVLFRRNEVTGRGRYVVHRILKIGKGGKYFIAGDNCTEGEIVESADVLGVLTAVLRDGKRVDSGVRYRLYLCFWCAPYHMRFLLLRVFRGIKYFFTAVKSKISGR